MIRRATQADLEIAAGFAAEFLAESVHSAIPLDQVALEGWMASLIDHGAVFLSERGFIGGFISPIYFNPAYRVAVELFWWAPIEGRALREAFEAWCVEQDVRAIHFSGQRNERAGTIEKLFRRAGYEPVETVFVKRL